jgi:putative membrane protein
MNVAKTQLIILPMLLLGACSRGAADVTNNAAVNATGPENSVSNSSANSAMTSSTADTPTYLAKAGGGDLFEIQSSQAILAKTGNADIKAFAQAMVTDHGTSTAKLKAAAKEAGITVPPPALDPTQQQALDSIKAATGNDADKAYLGAQRDAHAAALNLHQGYSASGDTPALKAAASEIVPVVEHHRDMLSKLHAD